VRLSDETRGLIGEKELSAAKPGALLINTARGGVVNEQALYRALVHGPLGGAACDVFASEPPTRENPLVGLPNFIATPHIGASTDEALLRVGLSAVTQIFDVLDGKAPAHECF
jgi:D-3-phosphoglycerate dehydrogenase